MESPFLRRVESSAPPPPMHVHYIPQGSIKEAWRSAEVPYTKRGRKSALHKAGLAYEKRVREWAFTEIAARYSLEVSPWFCFIDATEQRHYCQPDLLLVAPDRMIVVECKIRWTTDAWWQLRKLYIPVLAVALKKPEDYFVPLCICRSYDPAFPAPEPIALRTGLNVCSASRMNVMLVR